MRLSLLILFISTFILIDSKKQKKKRYNPDNVLVGIDNNKVNEIYNSQFRIRVRKLDPLFRTVLIKGIEPSFPNDINADGTSPLSENPYSKLPIKLHVPIIPIKEDVVVRRMPVISQSPTRLPLEANERLFSFAINICKLPSLWYIELAYCMHRGVTKYTTGILTSYTLQDIIGASLETMDLPSESFSLSRCKYSISIFSDIAINQHGQDICNTVLSCLTSKEFLEKNKGRVRKLEKEITNVYKGKPPFFRGQQPRSYAQKTIIGILMARREYGYEPSKSKYKKNKRVNIPDKLFYVIRYFNFIMILTEYLVRQGYKDTDAFEVSAKAYLKIGDKSLLQPTPIKMIAKCATLLINAHFKNNSVDYLPYINKATWCPFSNVVIQHACTELVSIGFINSEIEIPKNFSINELEYLAYPHLAHTKEESLGNISSKETKKGKSSRKDNAASKPAKKQTVRQPRAQPSQREPAISMSPSKNITAKLTGSGSVSFSTGNATVTQTRAPIRISNNNTEKKEKIPSLNSSNNTKEAKKQLDDILSGIELD
ncbi:putative secreted protein [Cryptosporidium canis]|nr:putative secreted protein [Cryptosporidium canis]